MNRDNIVQWAWESGDCVHIDEDGCKWMWETDLEIIERFAALVAAAEREACARVCDEQAQSDALGQAEKYRAMFIADTIRARGEE